jgi:hypothetical protein
MPYFPLLRPVAVAAVAWSLAACASTDYHFSQLTGSRYYQTPLDTYPVSILRVDDKDVMNGTLGRVVVDRASPYPSRFALVDAGPRQITVQGPPGGIGGTGETRTFPLDVAPCTRYYLVAVKNNRLATDFSIRVDYQEPVSGCTPA